MINRSYSKTHFDVMGQAVHTTTLTPVQGERTEMAVVASFDHVARKHSVTEPLPRSQAECAYLNITGRISEQLEQQKRRMR